MEPAALSGASVLEENDWKRPWGIGPVGWLVAVLAGGVVSVETFGSGLLLNWDQVIGSTIPVPPGFHGLGPELPRRVPFYGPLAIASDLVGGANTVALLAWLTVAAACIGVVRLIGDGVVGISLGVVYALSPFLLSRLAVGHLPLAAATAMLPHALVDLADRRRRWRWALLFALTGTSGVVVGIVPLVVATLRRERSLERVRSIIVLLVSQAAWVVPGLVVLGGGGVLPEAAAPLFRARIDGLLGPSRAIAGGGLFLAEEDVAARAPTLAALLGLSLALGAFGLVRSTSAGRTDARSNVPDIAWSAAVALVLFLAPTLPVVSRWWDRALVGPLAILRESHKFWPLLAIPLLIGLGRMLQRGKPAVAVALAGLTIVVGWSGLWGARGRLVPQPEPATLVAARALLDGGEHVVLELPWQRYGPSSLAGGRTVLSPGSWLIDARVISSGRAFETVASAERATPSEDAFAEIDEAVRAGRSVVEDLRTLGVDRVMVIGSVDADLYRRLAAEPGVTALVMDERSAGEGSVMLFAVDGVIPSTPASSPFGAAVWVAQISTLLGLAAVSRGVVKD